MILHDEELDVECSTEMMTRIFKTGYYFGSSADPLIGSALLDLLSFSSAFIIFAALAAAVFIFVGGAHLKTGTMLSLKRKVTNNYIPPIEHPLRFYIYYEKAPKSKKIIAP